MAMIFTFQYSLGLFQYHMQPGEIATPQMDISASAIADWWGNSVTDFNGPAQGDFPAGDLGTKCQFQLFDLGGQPILGNRPVFSGGSWRGKVAFRPLSPSMLGGQRLDVGLKFTAQDSEHSGQGGGTGTVLQIYLAQAGPVPKHKWAFSNMGVPQFMMDIPEGQENVMVTRDGAIWTGAYHP